MAKWAEVSRELEDTLRLKTKPVAYKKLEKAEELNDENGQG